MCERYKIIEDEYGFSWFLQLKFMKNYVLYINVFRRKIVKISESFDFKFQLNEWIVKRFLKKNGLFGKKLVRASQDFSYPFLQQWCRFWSCGIYIPNPNHLYQTVIEISWSQKIVLWRRIRLTELLIAIKLFCCLFKHTCNLYTKRYSDTKNLINHERTNEQTEGYKPKISCIQLTRGGSQRVLTDVINFFAGYN